MSERASYTSRKNYSGIVRIPVIPENSSLTRVYKESPIISDGCREALRKSERARQDTRAKARCIRMS